MKTSTIHFSKSLFFAILILFVFMAGCVQLNNSKPNDGDEKDMYDGPGLAAQFEFDRTKDPATGRVPREKYLLALEKTIQSKNENASAIGGLPWIERGPNADLYGPFGNSRANNDITSGRIRAVMVDSSDATHKTVFVGGVCGGLWKTTDITASPASWSAISDNLSNLAIAAICQDPRPGFQNIMYFCTGESYYNADGVQGNGVFKSNDYGASWTYLPSTSTFVNGTRILCDYLGNIYLATRGTGLLRSTVASGGAAWTNITPSTFPNSDITDMELSSTSAAGRLHITCGTVFSANGYRFTDIPVTVTAAAGWTSSTTALPSFTNRIEIACNGTTLYALPANNNPTNQVPIIYKSTDGGVNWATTGGVPSATWASGQGWYALAIDIDPSNASSFIIGGLDTWKTTNAGANWTQLSTWAGSSPVAQYVHADVHKIVWLDGGNKLIFASDGGVFYSSDKGVSIRDRNKGLRIKQFYSCAIHPATTNYFLAGAQDNGVHQFTNSGLSSTTEVNGGDGCFVAIDQLVPANQFGSYVFNTYNRSTDGGTNWAGVNFYKGTNVSASNFGSFINAWDYDNTNKIIYAGGDGGEFFRWTTPLTTASGNYFVGGSPAFPATANILNSITNFNGAKVTAVTVSPFTANRVYFGTNGGRVVYIDNAHTATSGTAGTNITDAGFPAGTVSCINTGTNDQNLICCFSNYAVNSVFVSTNGGTSWTSLDNNGVNLPDMPVRWCMFYPGDNTKAFIATETGVWQTDLINGTTTVWNANASFPAVRTDMIKYRSSDRTLAAATHGRGLWTAIVPTVATSDLSFQSATDAATEITAFTSGCRGYTDYTKYMVIANTPTGAATVTLSVAGGGTATQGVDYDITTNGNFAAPSMVLNFASGSGTAQPFTIRVYDDAAVESAENFTLNYATAGGNAQTGATNQTFTFTINDNDATPIANGTFSNAVGTYNANATAQAPFNASQAKYRIQALFTLAELNAAGITGTRSFTSMTLRVVTKNSTLPFTNFTISMANSGATNLSTGFQNAAFTSVFPAINYSTVAGDNLFNFGTPFAWDGTSNILINFCYDNAAAGTSDIVEVQSPFVANLTTYSNGVASSPCTAAASFISAARIKATFGTTVTGTPVSTALNSTKTTYLGPNDDAYFYDGSGNIIARIKNLTAFDYGCTQIIIDRPGSSSAQFWNTNTANYLLSKSFKVIPTNNTTTGSYQITFYYTAAEVTGWQTATGQTWATSAVQVAKVSNGFFVPDVTAVTPHVADVALVTGTKGTFGTDYTIRGDFSSTGFSGFGVGVAGVAVNTWLAGGTGNGNLPANWSFGTVPTGSADAIVPAGNTPYPVLTADLPVNNLTLGTGSTIGLGGFTLTINGGVTGSGTLTGSSTSNLTLGGIAGSLNFTSGSRTLKNLTLNNGATATLGTLLDITAGATPGSITVASGATLNTGGLITLKSDASGTARVGNSAGTINGNVTVERFIPARRAWKLLTAPVRNAGSIFTNWQNGGTASGSTGVNIWGPGGGAPPATVNGLYNGANYSMKQYVAVGNAWSSVTNTTTAGSLSSNVGGSVADNKSFILFVTNPFDAAGTNITPAGSAATTLRATGSLQQGDQTFAVGVYNNPDNQYTLVGNPYASPVNFTGLITLGTNATAIEDRFWILDPTLSTVGAYQLVYNSGGGAYKIAPAPYTGGPAAGDYVHLQSGQAVFVEPKAAGTGTLTFRETYKSTPATSPPVFLVPPRALAVNMYNGTQMLDGSVMLYDNNYATAIVAAEDVKKIYNNGPNVAIARNNTGYIIEARPDITSKDTSFLWVSNIQADQTYRFSFKADRFDPLVSAWLEDAFTNGRTAIDLSGAINDISFSTTTDPASRHFARFRIVYQLAVSQVPVSFVDVKASLQNTASKVEWTVSGELNVDHYEVEYSANGTSFTKLGQVLATGNTGGSVSYNYLHMAPVTGINYYRIKLIEVSGNIKYSFIVNVVIDSKGGPGIVVYPNPAVAKDALLQLRNLPAGKYDLVLITSGGQVVHTQQLVHSGGTAGVSMNLPVNMAPGMYRVVLYSANKTKYKSTLTITGN